MSIILRKIRSFKPINLIGRNIIVKTKYLIDRISLRWRVYGIVTLNLAGSSLKYYSEADDPNADSLFYGYNDEPSELELFALLAKRATVIFDIGANTGLFSVLSGIKNRNAQVYAFEPYTTNFNRLKKNIRLNELKLINSFKCAIGSENGSLVFYVPNDSRISLVASANKGFSDKFTFNNEVTYREEIVSQKTLDSFVEENAISQIDLIKIDVESHELEVLKGGTATIKKFHPLILCEIFLEDDEERTAFFERFVQENNYYIYWIIDSGIVFTDRIIKNPSGRSFLFSKKKASKNYYSIKEYDSFIEEIDNNSLLF
ncbi:hypothetical protein MYP_1018 [Sporocytophaga myxococcoides]|uniref:Methyltransferase FkbM domain-containing protein n=1 Tax=Sporocytophaga myxococcoides TaxID=153721 RepID=A0A098LA77_9BACT|nr:FkbM family methyltransferase [Sporocytophaga myxococcoides]GAL83790.1 hypothetical protein MYP_1018 [Sporocytophaga myxococcoides]